MANRKKEKSVVKQILILFLYLIVWWICLTLFTYAVGIDDSHVLFHFVNFLRLAVPIMVVIFWAPYIIVLNYEKEHGRRRKKKR